mmetsp:Transcript_54471/g.129837  ORF Transcript_54471/g.129837 Transcript_54471/m.129837 type:complete len:246 (-) Transcript_54471:65-802(-)
MGSRAAVINYLAGLDAGEVQRLLKASEEKRELEAALFSEPGSTAVADSDLSCLACADEHDCAEEEEGSRKKVAFQLDPAALEERTDLSEKARYVGTSDLQAALQDGDPHAVQKAFARADVSILDAETGWTCMHWLAHAASSGQNAGDDCGQVGMGDCCRPAEATPEMRKLACAILATPQAMRHVNVRDESGATPLMFAADAGDEEVCEWLLAAGADTTLKDDDGDTAAVWAEKRGHHHLAQLLTA